MLENPLLQLNFGLLLKMTCQETESSRFCSQCCFENLHGVFFACLKYLKCWCSCQFCLAVSAAVADSVADIGSDTDVDSAVAAAVKIFS